MYVVDNLVDNRECTWNDENTYKYAGRLTLTGTATDSVVDSNEMYNSDRIDISPYHGHEYVDWPEDKICANKISGGTNCAGGPFSRLYYAVEIKNNKIEKESKAGADSGILVKFATLQNSKEAVLTYGVVIANNILNEVDAEDGGGAIGSILTWYISGGERIKETLIYKNQINNPPHTNKIGIHLEESHTADTVIYNNQFEGVTQEIRDGGTDTVEVVVI